MSEEQMPDLAWIATCNRKLLEETELVLAELAAEMDVATGHLKVRMWRSGLHAYQAPMIGGPDPFGELRFKTLQMLLNRGVLKACHQEKPYYVIQANERIVRRTLEVVRRPELLNPATAQVVLPRPELDVSWVATCDRGPLDGAKEVLRAIKVKMDLLETPLTISGHGPTEGGFRPRHEQAVAMTKYRVSILNMLKQRMVIRDWTPLPSGHHMPARFQIDADGNAVEVTLAAINALRGGVGARQRPVEVAIPPVLPPHDPIEYEVTKTHRVERAKLLYAIIVPVVVAVILAILAFVIEPVRTWITTTYFHGQASGTSAAPK